MELIEVLNKSIPGEEDKKKLILPPPQAKIPHTRLMEYE